MRDHCGRAQPELMSASNTILRIEHSVPDYGLWKEAFDSDPIGRRRMGVRRYQILRPVDDDNYVMVDVEFDSRPEAEGLLSAMRAIWSRAEHEVSANQRAWIAEAVERREY